MDTIRNYLEGMFTGLGNNPEILRAKEELLAMMEDKYHELIALGKSENAAVGQVIAEFGNLDELGEVLGIKEQLEHKDETLVVSSSTATQMIEDYQRAYPKIGAGVVIIMLGVIVFLSLIGLAEVPSLGLDEDTMIAYGITTLFVFIALAVYIFITGTAPLKQYEHLQKEPFYLDTLTKNKIETKMDNEEMEYSRTTALSVILLILSFIPTAVSALLDNNLPIFIPLISLVIFLVLLKQYKLWFLLLVGGLITYISSLYGYNPLFTLSFTLLLVSLAVFSLIESSGVREAGKILLQQEEFSVKRKGDPLVDTVSGIYWIVVTAIYLAWSFITHDWHFTWVVWPISGLLFAALSIYLDYRSDRSK